MPIGNCFRCDQPGHWISDCPLKLNADDPPPEIHCPCGGGICNFKVSKTLENPDRRFYKCPTAQDCGFFKWCDKVTDEDIRFRPASVIRICPCGSGPCRRFTDDSGRVYFRCCIKEGFGACGYFQWEDVEMAPSVDAVNEIDFWLEADLIVSDVESSFNAAGGVPETANSSKDCQSSVVIEDAVSVSDVHSTTVKQGIPRFDLIVDEEPSVIKPDEIWMKTLSGDQPTNCDVSNLSVDEAMSDLVRDTVSSGSVVNNEMKNYEERVAGTGEVECSSPNLQDLIEQYNSDKLRLEIVSEKHVQVLSEFMGSYRRLRSLHEKTCHLRKMLLETEKEMACCEAETLEFGVSCREAAREMAESQKRMQETAEKLGKEVEALKHKEFVDMKRRRC